MFWTTLTPWESEEEIQRGVGNESGRGTSKHGASPRREHQRRRESQERERRDLLRGVKDAIRVSEDREQPEEQPSLVQPLLLPQEQEEHQQLQHQQQQPSLPLPTLYRPTQQGATSTLQHQQPQQEQRRGQQLQQEQQQQQPLLLQHSVPQPLTSQRVWGEPLAQPQPQPQPQVRALSLSHPQAMMPNRQPRSSFRDRMTTDAPTDGDFFVRQLCACLLATVILLLCVVYFARANPKVVEGFGAFFSVFLFVAKLYISLFPPPVLIIAVISSWYTSTDWKEFLFRLCTFPIQVVVYLGGVSGLLGSRQVKK